MNPIMTIQNDADLDRACKAHTAVILYGAGLVAHVMTQYILKRPYRDRLRYAAVKSRKDNPSEILGVPVVEMNEISSEDREAVFVVATLEQLHDEITGELAECDCPNIAVISGAFYREIRRRQADFTPDILCRQISMAKTLLTLMDSREREQVRTVNYQTFAPYMGIHKGEEIAVIATGPTLKKYRPIPGAVHIGVNTAYKAEEIPFTYYFVQDYTGKSIQTVEALTDKSFIKFFGEFMDCSDFHRKNEGVMEIPEQKAIQAGALRYYTDWPPESPIHRDIRYAPLMEYRSIIFPAIQFALFCNPQRIYLIGCDCSQAGHFNRDLQDKLDVACVLRGYRALKKFADKHYPETEIISVNPVGLKGLFKDWYTDRKEDMPGVAQ